MNPRIKNDEFYSKDDTEEFACENFFMNEPIFGKVQSNNPCENKQIDNYLHNINEHGVNQEKSINNICNKNDTNRRNNPNETTKYAMSDMISQAETNFKINSWKNSKSNSNKSQQSKKSSNFSKHIKITNMTNNNKNISNNQKLKNSNNYDLKKSQNDKKLLEFLTSNNLIDDNQEIEKLFLNQKNKRPVESENSKINFNVSTNYKLHENFMDSMSHNPENYQFHSQNNPSHLINKRGNNNNDQNIDKNYYQCELNGNINKMIENFITHFRKNLDSNKNNMIKPLLVNIVYEILGKSNLQEKLILYNLISSSFLPSIVESSNNVKGDNMNNTEMGNLINLHNTQPNINNNSYLPNRSNPKENMNYNLNESDLGSRSPFVNNEVISLTIENFCKFLFTNGYSIISRQNKQKNNNIQLNDIFGTLIKNNNIYNLIESSKNVKYKSNNNLMDNNDDSYKKKTKDNINCPHSERKHYAKNMCINCYRKNGREKKAWKCCHPERAHYARGMCQNCYLNLYHNELLLKNKEKLKIISENKENNIILSDEESPEFIIIKNNEYSEAIDDPERNSIIKG